MRAVFKQPRLRPATRKFLRFLAITGAVAAVSIIAPQLPAQILQNFLRGKHRFNRAKFREFGKRLARRGLVSLREEGPLVTFRLTPEGARLVEQLNVEELKIARPARWDGAWRIAVFDIPEHRRFARDAFRQTLYRLGFAQIQRSVFAFPFPCEKEIEQVVRAFQLERSVILFTATTVSDDARLCRRFTV